MAKNNSKMRWYIAELVVAHQIANKKNIIVHINTTLVSAVDAKQANIEARKIGKAQESKYINIYNQRVVSRFLGVHDLNIVDEALEHGSELFYSQRIFKSIQAAKRFASSSRKEAEQFPPKASFNLFPKIIADEILKMHEDNV